MIYNWNCGNIDCSIIDENYVYTIKSNFCYVYNFEGNLIKT
jgi:hypothetical protein